MQFEPFPKIARLKRELILTEKLDGTNAQVAIFPLDSEEVIEHARQDPYCLAFQQGVEAGDVAHVMYAGSRKRWIAPEGHVLNDDGTPRKGTDNFAFARWVFDNSHALFALGEGRHYGEWYGSGIQRGYGIDEKRFALFNVARWNPNNPNRPACCDVVPTLAFDDPEDAMESLYVNGSVAVPGFRQPEGIIVWHSASHTYYKQTFDMDDGKWRQA